MAPCRRWKRATRPENIERSSLFCPRRPRRASMANTVVVQLKLTVLTDPARVADIVPLISKYANSQNKVNAADFSANGPYHQQLERLSRMRWAPPPSGLERGPLWYYERARGSYMDDKARQGTPARIRQWVSERPPEQKFTKTDLAKFEHAWAGLPHLACKGAEKNFVEFAQRHPRDVAQAKRGVLAREDPGQPGTRSCGDTPIEESWLARRPDLGARVDEQERRANGCASKAAAPMRPHLLSVHLVSHHLASAAARRNDSAW